MWKKNKKNKTDFIYTYKPKHYGGVNLLPIFYYEIEKTRVIKIFERYLTDECKVDGYVSKIISARRMAEYVVLEEKDLDVLKLKSLLSAIEMNWNIKEIKI